MKKTIGVLLALFAVAAISETFVEVTASGGGRYECFLDGESQSTHTTEHKASQQAVNLKLANPDSDVYCEQQKSIVATLTAAGRALINDADAGIVIVESPSNQASIDADFVTRATQSSNVLYATNFDDVYQTGTLNVGRSGISNTAEMETEAIEIGASAGNQEWDSTTKLSGTGALRIYRTETDTQNGGSWAFRPDGTQDGTGSTGTVHTTFYTQLSVRFSREDLAYKDRDGLDVPKVIKFGQFFENGEFVITNPSQGGFIGAQNNGSSGASRSLTDTALNGPFDGQPTDMIQNAIFPVGDLTGFATMNDAMAAVGPVNDRGADGQWLGGAAGGGDYRYELGNEWLDLRSDIAAQGFPNTAASTLGVPWLPDEWVTVEIYVDSNTDRAMVWGARYGQAPRLIIDTQYSTNPLLADPASHYNYIQLLNQRTGALAYTGRPLQNRWYDEIITSLSPIPFPNPGGTPYTLPNLPTGAQTGLETLAASLTSGQSAVYQNGGVPFTSADLAWQTTAHYYETDKIFHVLGKPANNNTAWTHQIFDTNSETWTNHTNSGASAPGTINSSGHIYANSAQDPATGDLFFSTNSAANIRAFDYASLTWGTTTSPSTGSSTPWSGMSWLPTAYGPTPATDAALVVSTRGGAIYLQRVGGTTWDQIQAVVGDINATREAGGQLANGFVYIVGKDGEPLYEVVDSTTINNRGNPPIDHHGGGASATHGTIVEHPGSPGDLIMLENIAADTAVFQDRWWISTDRGVSWTLQPADHPLTRRNATFTGWSGGPFVSIPALDVIVWFSDSGIGMWKP